MHKKLAGRRTRRNSWLLTAAALAAAKSLQPAAAYGQITFLNTWGSLGSGNGQFNGPVGVAVGPDGSVYVVDSMNDRVQVFDPTGEFQSSFGSVGTGNGQFNGPIGVAAAANGTVYVTDVDNNRVETFNSAGVYQSQFGSSGSGQGEFESPTAVAVDPVNGSVYVTDDFNGRVENFNPSGGFLDSITSIEGNFNQPDGVAVSSTGTIYVADSDDNRIAYYNPSPVQIGSFGSYGTGNGQFNFPIGVAVGATGNVYVADGNTNQVQVFNSTGSFMSSFGGVGSGNGEFDFSEDVAVAPTGMVYVTDFVGDRVQRFFDPSSWVSGTNTFTDPTIGPTSLAVGPGQILGTNLSLNSAMGLTVGNTLTVESGGTLTQEGGSLTCPTLNIYGVFNDYGGTFSATQTQLFAGGTFAANIATIPAGGSLVQYGGQIYTPYMIDGGFYSYIGGTFTPPTLLDVSTAAHFYAPTLSWTITSGQSLSVSCDLGAGFTLDGLFVDSGGNVTLSGNPSAGFSFENGGIGVSSGGSFTFQGGSLTTDVISVTGMFQATQGGELTATDGLAVAGNGEVLLDGGTSLSCGTISMQGGLLVVGNADLSVTGMGQFLPFRISAGAEVQLQDANTSIITTPELQNQGGLLDGSGRINAALVNDSGGRVSVATGQTMTITGAGNANDGLLSLTGGELHFTQDLTNESDGSVDGTGTLEADGGFTNNGVVSVGGLPTYLFGTIANNAGANLNLAGTSYVFGNVTNAATANVHLSGLTNVFYGTFANSGNLNVDQGASGLLYGAYSGNGPIVNNGFLYIDATSVAGQVSGGGTITLGSAGVPTQLQLLPLGQTSTQAGVTINSGSTLDVTNNALKINFGSPANDPIKTIVSELTNGYANGTWTGTSPTAGVITSSTVAGIGAAVSVGYLDGNIDTTDSAQVAPNQILVKFTLTGDTNLDGIVNFTDFAAVLKNFAKQGTDWAEGNFTYNPNSPSIQGTNFTDFADVLKNFLQPLPGGGGAETIGGTVQPLSAGVQIQNTVVPLPEPASLSLVAAGAAGLLGRRKRRVVTL